MARPLAWDAALTQKFWDALSKQPEKYFTYQFGEKIAEMLARHVPRTGLVLDYGCGTGFLLPHLASRGFKVHGTDTSPDSITHVRTSFASLPGFCGAELLGDQLKIGVRFDAIFVVEVIEHINDNHLTELFQNVRSLMNPGGVAIFTTPNEERLEDSEVYCPVCDHTFHRWQHVRNWTSKSLSDLLSKNGFRVKEAYGTNFDQRKTGGIRGRLMNILEKIIMPPAKPHLVAVCEIGSS